MHIIFMGTGTSQGVPMIGCDCEVCTSEDTRNWRTRPSIHIVVGESHLQVDVGPDFRYQCLVNDIRRIDEVLLTHAHADHIMGMDDLRRFVDFREGEGIPVHGSAESLARMEALYPYAIMDRPLFRGYPAFKPVQLTAGEVYEFPWGKLETTDLPHGRFKGLGLVFTEAETGSRFAYYTDCAEVPEAAEALARGSDVVVLDGLRPESHPTHMNIEEAVKAAQRIAAPMTYLTHMTHHVDHGPASEALPEGVEFAFDGLRLSI